MSAAIRDRIVARAALDGHDGRSGAQLERVRLDDGTTLVVKRAAANSDLTVGPTGGEQRERALWASGALDRLPAEAGHAIVDAWDDDGVTVIVMRDVGESIPGWNRVIDRAECSRILTALTSMHAAFSSDVPPDLCPLDTRLTLMSPRVMRQLAGGSNPLPGTVLKGWDRFAEVVDGELVDAVFDLHDDPARLVAMFADAPTTLLHGDLWPVNLALETDRVVFLDWALATAGPPALDLAIFLTGAAAHIEPSREDLIAEFRARSKLTDERSMSVALLGGLVELGWNKALDATSHPDESVRARECADLDWWLDQGRRTLDQYGG